MATRSRRKKAEAAKVSKLASVPSLAEKDDGAPHIHPIAALDVVIGPDSMVGSQIEGNLNLGNLGQVELGVSNNNTAGTPLELNNVVSSTPPHSTAPATTPVRTYSSNPVLCDLDMLKAGTLKVISPALSKITGKPVGPVVYEDLIFDDSPGKVSVDVGEDIATPPTMPSSVSIPPSSLPESVVVQDEVVVVASVSEHVKDTRNAKTVVLQ